LDVDRIDIHVEVPAVKFREMTAERTGESSAQNPRLPAVPNRTLWLLWTTKGRLKKVDSNTMTFEG